MFLVMFSLFPFACLRVVFPPSLAGSTPVLAGHASPDPRRSYAAIGRISLSLVRREAMITPSEMTWVCAERWCPENTQIIGYLNDNIKKAFQKP